MSMRALSEIAETLPRPISEDVIGYARSVQSALPEIFREARIPDDPNLGDRVVLLAGLKKLESILSSHFWTLDNSLRLMEEAKVRSVRIGQKEISRGSDYHQGLYEAIRELEEVFAKEDLSELLHLRSYSDMLSRLRV